MYIPQNPAPTTTASQSAVDSVRAWRDSAVDVAMTLASCRLFRLTASARSRHRRRTLWAILSVLVHDRLVGVGATPAVGWFHCVGGAVLDAQREGRGLRRRNEARGEHAGLKTRKSTGAVQTILRCTSCRTS